VEDKAFISIFGFLFIFGDIEFQINVFWMKGGVAFFLWSDDVGVTIS
jgi:hypothetical protein